MSIVVERVYTENGSRIEPPLKQTWSQLRKLQWHAAVCMISAPFRVEVIRSSYAVRTFGVWVPQPGHFDVIVGNSSAGPFRFNDAWLYISGVDTACQESDNSERPDA